MLRLIVSVGTVLILFSPLALAQEQAPTAQVVVAAQPIQDQDVLTVTVTKVSGSVQVRPTADEPWKLVKLGDTYTEGTEILTGFNSSVELQFADNSTTTVKRVTLFRVEKFRREGNKVVTLAHLSYGKVTAGVEKGPAFSDYKITTPLGTLGVNGTREIGLYVDPGSGQAVVTLSQQGNIGWNTGSGSGTPVDPGGSSDGKGSGQDQTGKGDNNVGLLDQFGSTGTEQGVGSSYGNQGSNTQTGGPSSTNNPTDPYGHHGRLEEPLSGAKQPGDTYSSWLERNSN